MFTGERVMARHRAWWFGVAAHEAGPRNDFAKFDPNLETGRPLCSIFQQLNDDNPFQASIEARSMRPFQRDAVETGNLRKHSCVS